MGYGNLDQNKPFLIFLLITILAVAGLFFYTNYTARVTPIEEEIENDSESYDLEDIPNGDNNFENTIDN